MCEASVAPPKQSRPAKSSAEDRDQHEHVFLSCQHRDIGSPWQRSSKQESVCSAAEHVLHCLSAPEPYLQSRVILLVKVVPHIQAAIHFDGVKDTRPVQAGVVPSVVYDWRACSCL